MADFDNVKVSFLYIGLYSMGKDWFYPESVVPYHMLRYVVKGEADFWIDGEKIHVVPNDIVYIPRDSRLACVAAADTFEFYSVRFITSFYNDGDDLLEKYYGISRVIQGQGEDVYFKEMYRWVKSDHIAKKSFVRGNLYLLIGSLSVRGVPATQPLPDNVAEKYELKNIVRRETKSHRKDSRVTIVADYVMLHPEERYTPEKMADMVGLSKQRFSALFKQHMGKTPMEYCREIRLSTAARKLLVSTATVNEIAYEVGYEDTNYFIREFKRAFGYTPNRYRVEAKEF